MRFGDQDIGWGDIGWDALWLGVSFGAGHVLKPISLTVLRVTSTQLVQRVTEVRPLLGIITSTGKALVFETRTTVNIVRVARITAVNIPLHLDQIFNVHWALHKDIPTYFEGHPEVGRQLEGRPASQLALGLALGQDVSCSIVHTPIPGSAEP